MAGAGRSASAWSPSSSSSRASSSVITASSRCSTTRRRAYVGAYDRPRHQPRLPAHHLIALVEQQQRRAAGVAIVTTISLLDGIWMLFAAGQRLRTTGVRRAMDHDRAGRTCTASGPAPSSARAPHRKRSTAGRTFLRLLLSFLHVAAVAVGEAALSCFVESSPCSIGPNVARPWRHGCRAALRGRPSCGGHRRTSGPAQPWLAAPGAWPPVPSQQYKQLAERLMSRWLRRSAWACRRWAPLRAARRPGPGRCRRARPRVDRPLDREHLAHVGARCGEIAAQVGVGEVPELDPALLADAARARRRSRAPRGTARRRAPATRRRRSPARSPAGASAAIRSVSKRSVATMPGDGRQQRASSVLDGVEDRLLVLLQVAVVRQRQALERRQQPVRLPISRPALPRASSAMSGFFFCGMIDRPGRVARRRAARSRTRGCSRG